MASNLVRKTPKPAPVPRTTSNALHVPSLLLPVTSWNLADVNVELASILSWMLASEMSLV